MSNKCKTCRYRDGNGFCKNEKIAEEYCYDNNDKDDMLIYSYNEGGGFKSGDNFGCIHHDEIIDRDKIINMRFKQEYKDRLYYVFDKIETICLIPFLILAIPLDMLHQKYNLKIKPSLMLEIKSSFLDWKDLYFNGDKDI